MSGCARSYTIVGYDETGGTKWSVVAPAIGIAVGGAVLAFVGAAPKKSAERDRGWKLAMAGTGAGVSYSW